MASHCCVNRPVDRGPEGQDDDLFWNMSDCQVGDKSESCAGGDEFELGCEVDRVGDGSRFEAREPACPADHRAAGQVNRCGDPIAVGELFECNGRPSRGDRVADAAGKPYWIIGEMGDGNVRSEAARDVRVGMHDRNVGLAGCEGVEGLFRLVGRYPEFQAGPLMEQLMPDVGHEGACGGRERGDDVGSGRASPEGLDFQLGQGKAFDDGPAVLRQEAARGGEAQSAAVAFGNGESHFTFEHG